MAKSLLQICLAGLLSSATAVYSGATYEPTPTSNMSPNAQACALEAKNPLEEELDSNIKTRYTDSALEEMGKNIKTDKDIKDLPSYLDGKIVIMPIIAGRGGEAYNWQGVLREISEHRAVSLTFAHGNSRWDQETRSYLLGENDSQSTMPDMYRNLLDALRSSGRIHSALSYSTGQGNMPAGGSRAYLEGLARKVLDGNKGKLRIISIDCNEAELFADALKQVSGRSDAVMLFRKGHVTIEDEEKTGPDHSLVPVVYIEKDGKWATP
ncbi:MAG: hypothetical protein AABX47_10015 [Nanoarchaeota archaeon]